MPDLQEELTAFIGLIYEAASDSRQWQYVLEELRKKIGASAVAWADYDFIRREGSIIHTTGYYPEYISLYKERFAALNVWMQPGEYYRQGQVSVGEDIVSQEKLLKTEFYNDWLKPQNFFYRICGVVDERASQVFYLKVMRDKARGAYEPQIKYFLASVIPHLRKGMQRNHYLWQLAVIEDALSHLPYGVVVVNKQSQVLFANHFAKEILHKSNGLFINADKLHAHNTNANMQLKQLISKVASESNTLVNESELLLVRRDNSFMPLWVIISPMRRRLRRVIGQEIEVAIVFVSLPEYLGELPLKAMRKFYGLTKAETRLAHLILKGRRLEEAAEELEVSQNTVRTHMKRIYAKTGTERQVDLVRLIMSGTNNYL